MIVQERPASNSSSSSSTKASETKNHGALQGNSYHNTKPFQKIVVIYQQTTPQDTAQSKFCPHFCKDKIWCVCLDTEHTIEQHLLIPPKVQTVA